jgi:hypothetical protein
MILALCVLAGAVPVAGAIVAGRIEYVVKTGAGARDSLNYDLPPDQVVGYITNGFTMLETNLASTASVMNAVGQSSARQRAEVQPLLITAAGSLSAAASANTNRDENASAQANCRFDLLFDLPVQHTYSITVTNNGSVSPGSLLGQIVLTRSPAEIFASRLPTNSGPSSQSGTLPAGSYRLLAEFALNPTEAPPSSSGNAAYSLRMEFVPILPVLNITQSSNSVILSWTTNDTASFLLQSNTNLPTTNWAFIYGPYSIVGEQYSVLEGAIEERRFYRLIVP